MRERGERAALAGILAVAGALRVLFAFRSSPTDDAYITFRYARNLAAGLGFVYNSGERVLGTTTPLFTLLLAPAALLHIPLETAARVLAVAADLGVVLLIYRLIRGGWGRDTALLAAGVYGTFYAVVGACGYGMETQVFTFFVMAALASAVAGRSLQAGAAAALAVLTRPDGSILAGILVAASLYGTVARRKRMRLGPAVVFLGMVLPWVLFATFYFGSPVPNSMVAKFNQQNVAFERWVSFFFTRNPLVILLWLGALAGGVAGIVRRSKTAFLLAAWAATYPIFFLIGRPPFLGVWYFPPLVPALAGLFAVGAMACTGPVLRSGGARLVLLGGAWILAVCVGLPRNLESARWSRTLAERVYRPMAGWVVRATDASDVVQVSDIGYVGYFTGRTILDSGALVSPEVAAYYREHGGDSARDVQYVLVRKPRIVILPANRAVIDRFVAGGFLEAYRPAVRFQPSGTAELSGLPRAMETAGGTGRFVADFIAFERTEDDE